MRLLKRGARYSAHNNRALSKALEGMKDTQSEAETLSFITYHPLLVVAGVLIALFVIARFLSTGIKSLSQKTELPGA